MPLQDVGYRAWNNERCGPSSTIWVIAWVVATRVRKRSPVLKLLNTLSMTRLLDLARVLVEAPLAG